MVDMVNIVHKNYEKISDELMWLSKNWILKFTVVLNKYSDKFGRQNYHKEVGYWKNNEYCININRVFDYYLSIESSTKDDFGNKQSIQIRLTDMYIFVFKLNQVSEWFTAANNSGLFAKKNGKIIMVGGTQPIKVLLSFDNYIEFEPSILNLDNGDQLIGVRMYLNSDRETLFIDINRFLAFKYFIENFNMYQSAQMMINYLQRPELGTNMFDMGNAPKQKHTFLK